MGGRRINTEGQVQPAKENTITHSYESNNDEMMAVTEIQIPASTQGESRSNDLSSLISDQTSGRRTSRRKNSSSKKVDDTVDKEKARRDAASKILQLKKPLMCVARRNMRRSAKKAKVNRARASKRLPEVLQENKKENAQQSQSACNDITVTVKNKNKRKGTKETQNEVKSCESNENRIINYAEILMVMAKKKG